MSKKLIKKIIKRLFIVCLVSISFLSVKYTNAASGYMYSSDGKIIESSSGYTVTEENIFNILSDAWKKGFSESNTLFNSPSDLFIYEDTIYICDESSNYLFVFDENLVWKQTIKQFPIVPSKFTNKELAKINTANIEVKDGNESRKISSFWTADKMSRWEKIKDNWSEIEKTPFDRREEEQKFFIECVQLSGIYRCKRPLRDENYKIVLDESGKTVYQDVILLCDGGNKQVLIVDSNNYEVLQVLSAPEGVDFASKYQPSKAVMDSSGRSYIISTGIYEGILLINYNGDFMTMVGVNYTTLSVLDALKRSWKTEEQLAQETTILQTIFTNLTIDKDGFLYTLSGPVKNADGSTSKDAMIKKINQTNSDVLKRNGYSKPVGDLITINTGANAGSSNFSSITVNEYGVYTVADKKYCRLFTYDSEGNLLYISGDSGSQVTNISIPVAIAYQGENILLLDKGNKCVMRFKPTNLAQSVNRAVKYEYYGDKIKAAAEWQNVINSNPAYELAYVGVGKMLYSEGRYQEAMLNYMKGNDVKNFSRAYKKYRDDKIAIYFPYFGGTILVLIGANLVWKVVKKTKNKKSGMEDGEL